MLCRLGPGSMRVISPASVADADLVADAGLDWQGRADLGVAGQGCVHLGCA